MSFLVAIPEKFIERKQGSVEGRQLADFVRSEHAANIDGDRRETQECELGRVASRARGGTYVR